MGGKMPASWWREYRARRRAEGRPVHRREGYVRRDHPLVTLGAHRRVQYAQPKGPLPPLFPDLFKGGLAGAEVILRSTELAFDLRQERTLAVLEGRDPEEAVRAYRRREAKWIAITTSMTDWAA